MTEIYIIQRQTLDWASIDLAAFRSLSVEFCRRLGRRDDFAFRLAELWNNTFACSYFETRARLKSLSEKHNSAITHTRFVPYQSTMEIPLAAAGYVFIDDDDWFSPDLGETLLPQIERGENFLLWRTTNIGSPKQATPVFYWGLNGRCMTNNYLASGRWVREQNSLDSVFRHRSAVETLENEEEVRQLDCCLSVSNKGPISTMSLARGLGNARDPETLASMVSRYLEQMHSITASDLAHVPWSEALLAETIDIYRAVHDSRR